MRAHLAWRFVLGLGITLGPVLFPVPAQAQPAPTGPAHESIGPVYPIAERDALQALMGRMARKMTPQRLARWREHQTNQARARTLEPVPVAGLVRATQRTRRVFDPALDVPQAIQDADGRTVVPAGARINPLAVLKLTRRLAFFDARDPEQVNAIERLLAREGTPIKPVPGAPLEPPRVLRSAGNPQRAPAAGRRARAGVPGGLAPGRRRGAGARTGQGSDSRGES